MSPFLPNPPRLPGPRVLVTRSPAQGSELADHLRAFGAVPVLIPAIELAPPSSWAGLDAALRDFGSFDWVLFTSANAVEAFARRRARIPGSWRSTPFPAEVLRLDSQDDPEPQLPKIAAIGPATARALGTIGLAPDLLPPQAVAESFSEALLPYVRQPDGRPAKFLLVRAEEAREVLPQTLRDAGAVVTVAPAYRTMIPESSVRDIRELFTAGREPPAAITFTSSSTARNLLSLCEAAGVALPETALRISIGPITTQTLTELGLAPHAEATEATVTALAQATLEALQGAKKIS